MPSAIVCRPSVALSDTMPRTNVDYWAAKIDRNRGRDIETDSLLVIEGWTVIRVWEHEDPKLGAERVREALARR